MSHCVRCRDDPVASTRRIDIASSLQLFVLTANGEEAAREFDAPDFLRTSRIRHTALLLYIYIYIRHLADDRFICAGEAAPTFLPANAAAERTYIELLFVYYNIILFYMHGRN